jgi:hypothetical protein
MKLTAFAASVLEGEGKLRAWAESVNPEEYVIGHVILRCMQYGDGAGPRLTETVNQERRICGARIAATLLRASGET